MTKAATATGILAVVAALEERERAKTASTPDDNPFAHYTVEHITGGVGIRKAADNYPAVNMAAQAPDDPAAFSLESTRIAGLDAGHLDRSAKRMAKAKARVQRKAEFDTLAESTVVVDRTRLMQAWLVVVPLVLIVSRVAKSKQRWANRLLGSSVDDLPQMALEQMATMLAKQSKWDLDILRRAAHELAANERGIPGDQVAKATDTEERKTMKKARKWIMGMVNNRVMGALADSYTNERNLRWENLDLIATVMATINGTADDAMHTRFKADRAPAFLGTKFQRTDGFDGTLLAVAINAAIEDRGLDALTDFILNDEHRRTDGAVQWTKYAKDIFVLSPGGYGEWMWEQVKAATADHQRARHARGEAAMNHVRNLFSFLPDTVVSIVDSFNHQALWRNHVGGHTQAVMASDFELHYLPDPVIERLGLQPALRYGSVEEAAVALTEHLAQLQTGVQYVASIVNT